MIDKGEIVPVLPRQAPETRQVVMPSAPITRGYWEVDGWTIRVLGDAIVVTCDGEVMTQTRTGQLNQKETIISYSGGSIGPYHSADANPSPY